MSNSKRPVALVDVDGTLIFEVLTKKGNVIQYNDTLLDSLKKKGVRDICLPICHSQKTALKRDLN
jgi:hypothetical protein